VANKDEMTKDARRAFIAKASAGDWDSIVMTHSGFEKIGLSNERQAEFIHKEIADYEQAIRDSAGDRLTVKMLEKSKKTARRS